MLCKTRKQLNSVPELDLHKIIHSQIALLNPENILHQSCALMISTTTCVHGLTMPPDKESTGTENYRRTGFVDKIGMKLLLNTVL